MCTSFPMPDSLTVGTSNVMFSQSVKTLGMTLDTHLTMKKADHKYSQNWTFRTPTHQIHSSLFFCRSYTEACFSLCHVQTRLLQISSLWLSQIPHQQTSQSSEQCYLPHLEGSWNWPYYAKLASSTLASSRCKNSVQNLLSELRCYQLFWPSVPCWPY